jgi:hypothetical protein
LTQRCRQGAGACTIRAQGGDHVPSRRHRPWPFTVEAFHEWLDTRSPEEHWELIEGIAVMTPAPLIASNFERYLVDRAAGEVAVLTIQHPAQEREYEDI